MAATPSAAPTTTAMNHSTLRWCHVRPPTHWLLPLAVRGYRMSDVDEVLARLATELEDRDSSGGPGPA
jgi:DivIVA domain-containing protein